MTASLLFCPVCRHDWSWHDIDGCGADCPCDRPGRWRLVIDWLGRPHLANTERQKHWRTLSRIHSTWRQAGLQAAQLARIPKDLPPCEITAWGLYRCLPMPDPAGIAPSVKCAVDGLVDHGCWPDDTAAWVRSESYASPVLDRTLIRHGLVVVVNAVDA